MARRASYQPRNSASGTLPVSLPHYQPRFTPGAPRPAQGYQPRRGTADAGIVQAAARGSRVAAGPAPTRRTIAIAASAGLATLAIGAGTASIIGASQPVLGPAAVAVPATGSELGARATVEVLTDDAADLRQARRARSAATAALPWFIAPHAGQISSGFGMRMHPILGIERMHEGVDITTGCDAPIAASAAGTVTSAGSSGEYGFAVVVDHGVHDGHRVSTRYAHLSRIGVKTGQRVAQGQGLGLSGSTGLSTACHLHFEVLLDGSQVDPQPWLAGKPTVTPTGTIPDLTPTEGPEQVAAEAKATAVTGSPSILEEGSIQQRIRFCESSNNYAATNSTSTASGAYQFLDGTWRMIPTSVRGDASRAMYASVAEQDAAFRWLYAQQGTSPWLASKPCWGTKTDVPTTVTSVAPVRTTTSTATATKTTSPTTTAEPIDDTTATATPTTSSATPTSTATQTATATATESPAPSASPSGD